MVSKKELAQREEQVVEFLRRGLSEAHTITPKYLDKRLVPDRKVPYLLVDMGEKKQIILPAYAHIHNQDAHLISLADIARNQGMDTIFLLYKDGKNFFRNAAEKKDFKRRYNLSLKHYRSDETRRMILLSLEERAISKRKIWTQYYQPSSPRLKERLVSFRFQPVKFDYSHIDEELQFKPNDRYSERLSIWHPDSRVESKDRLIIDGGYIKSLKLDKRVARV